MRYHALRRNGVLGLLARRMALGGAAALAVCAPAWAGPQDPTVVAGSATFSGMGPTTNIRASNGTIINWQSFNIGRGERVNFFLPNSQGRVLNRITGSDPSTIAGTLWSNGIVYIANPAGVYFRQGAVVNVGGIYAAAGQITDRDFLANHNQFTQLSGQVINEGVIQSQSTTVLAGRQVVNAGEINSAGGMVVLAAGDDVFVGTRGSSIYARVDNTSGGKKDGGDVGVLNSGTIKAEGGQVALAAGDIFGVAIRNTGTVRAARVRAEGFGRDSAVEIGGTIDASNRNPGQRGGDVTITGSDVRLSGATIDASGAIAGGRIRVGGDYQGGGDLRRADRTVVGPDSRLIADGVGAGAVGGTVIVWSEVVTGFYGVASVRGGEGGAGGLIETSSRVALDVRGAKIDGSALNGTNGLWLIDPRNVRIANGGTAISNPFEPNADDAIIDVVSLTTALSGGANVEIRTFDQAGVQAGNITVESAINPNITGTATLRLRAANDITISAPISATGGSLRLELSANDSFADRGGDDTNPALGSVFLNAAVNTNGGAFTVNNVFDGANLSTSTLGTVRGFSTGLNGTINTGSGAVTILTTGANAITQGVTAGSVTVRGSTLALGGTVNTSGAQLYEFSGFVNVGMQLASNTTLNATNANITLNNAAGGFNLARGAINGPFSLTLNAGTGNINLNAPLGFAGVGPTSLTATGTTITIGSNRVTTDGPQTYNGGLVLTQITTTILAQGLNSPLTFNGTVRAQTNGGQTLFADSTGNIFFNGAVGDNNQRLGALVVQNVGNSDVTAFINGGSISTAGLQQFDTRVVVGADTVLNAQGGVTFNSQVNGATAGGQSLSLNGDATFNGVVGGAQALGALTVSGATVFNSTGVSTTDAGGRSGLQNYAGPVTVARNLTVSAGGGNVTFQGAVDADAAANNRTLTINSGGVTSFNVAVGGNEALASLTTDALGGTIVAGTVTTTGAQTYNDQVSLAGANGTTQTFTGSTVTFANTLNAAGIGQQGVQIAGNGAFGAAVGAVTALRSIAVSGATTIGSSVATSNAAGGSGAQSYSGAVTLGGAVGARQLTASGVTFGSTVNATGAGVQGLNVTGNAVFNGAVGGATALRGVNISGTTGLNGASVTTTNVAGGAGTQIYTGAVTLGTDVALTSGPGGVTFGSTVDGTTAGGQGLTVSGPLSLAGNIGGTTRLSTLVANGATTLNQNATLSANDITINDVVGNAFALTLDSVNSTTLGGTIGQTSSVSSLTIQNTGTTAFNGAGINSTGAVSLGQAVTLGGAAVNKTISGSTVSFGRTVNATSAGSHGLSITGNTTFADTVGAAQALRSVSVTGTTALNGSSVATSNAGGGTGNQTYTGAATLGANTTLTATGGTASFASTLNGARTLAITGNASFGGNVGGTNALTSLAVTGTSQLAGNITTAGAQTYTGAATLGGTAGVRSLTGSSVAFGSTVNATNAGVQGLGITGDATFGGAVGSTQALRSVAVSGATGLNGGPVVTTSAGGGSGIQTYTGAVTLGTNTTLTSTGGSVVFGSTVDGTTAGGQGLTVSGPLSLAGNIGGTTRLSTLVANGATTLNQNATLSANDITINDVVGNAFALTLDSVNSTTLGGTIGQTSSVSSLTIQNTGTTAFNGAGINSTGAVSLGQAVTLGGAAVNKTISGSTVSFGRTVNATSAGSHGLSITGNTTFADTVGAAQALRSVSVTGTTALNGSSVATSNAGGGTGNQTYTGAATLGANTTFTSTGGTVAFGNTVNAAAAGAQGMTVNGRLSLGGNVGGIERLSFITANGVTTLTQDTTLSGADVALNDVIGNNFSLTLDTTNSTTLGGTIGQTSSVSSLTIQNTGTTAFNGAGVNSTGAVSLGQAITLGGASANKTIAGSTVSFGGTVDSTSAGSHGVSVTGNTTFAAAVGAAQTLRSVSVTGTTALNGASVATSNAGGGTGNQTYAGAATLGAATTLTSTGGTVGFTSTLNGGQTLTVTGNASLGGNVGGTTALTSLDVSGTTQVAGNVTTTGAQTYTGAVTLGGSAGVRSLTATTVAFGSTVNATGAGVQGLGVSGDATFGGSVGNSVALRELSVTGTQVFSGVTVATTNAGGGTGNQTYTGATTLGNSVTFSAGSGSVTFSGAVDGDAAGRALAVNTTGLTTFSQAVGGTQALGTVSLSGPAAIDGGVVSTTGAQSYGGLVTLGNSTSFNAGTGGVAFNNGMAVTTDDTFEVTVNGDGLFSGDIGSDAVRPRSLTVTGGTTLAAANIFTERGATFTGATTLGGAVGSVSTVTAPTGATISFGTIDSAAGGARSLTVGGGAAKAFGGQIGGTNAVGALTVNGSGEITLSQDVTTTAGQTYNGPVLIASTVALTDGSSAASGNGVVFGSTVDSVTGTSEDLRINTPNGGVTVFGGAVGSITALGSLLTDATGATRINGGSVNVLNDINFLDAVTLNAAGGATTITSTNGTIRFGGTLGGQTDNTQSLSLSGNAQFDGAVGLAQDANENPTNRLTSLSVSGTTFITGGGVRTTGDQTYTGAFTLGGTNGETARLVAGTGNVTFSSTVDGSAAGSGGPGRGLVIDTTGTTSFTGNIGGTEPVASLTMAGSGAVLLPSVAGATVRTVGAQTFSGPLTMRGDTTFRTSDAAMTFNGDIGGAHNLTIDSGTATSTFAGALGTAADRIGTGTGAAINILSTGSTVFNGAVFTASGITNASGPTTFAGNVDILAGDTASSFRSVTLAGVTFTSTGAVTFGSNTPDEDTLRLTTDSVTLNTAQLVVNSNMVGNQNITINTGNDTAVFNGTIGGPNAADRVGSGNGRAIALLSTDLTTFNGTIDVNSGMSATGAVRFANDARFRVGAGQTPTASSFDGNVTFSDASVAFDGGATFGTSATNVVQLENGTITLSSLGNALVFNSIVNGNQNLVVDAGAGAVTFNAAAGGNDPTSRIGSGTGTAFTSSGTGTVTFADLLRTNGRVAIAGGANFQNDVDILAGSDTAASTIGGNTTLGFVDANNSANNRGVTFNAATGVTFGGGDPGSTTVSLVGGSSTVTATDAAVTFNSAVSGNQNLTISGGTGAVSFNGDVGGTTNATRVGSGAGRALVVNSTGATSFAGQVRGNSGMQVAGPVTFNGNVDLQAGTGTAASVFNNTVTLTNLSIFNAANGATFGASGGPNAFTFSNSSANQRLVISAAGNALVFNGTVNGAQPLAIDAGTGANAGVTFAAAVGGTTAPRAMVVTARTANNTLGPISVANNITTQQGLAMVGNVGLTGNSVMNSGNGRMLFAGNITRDGTARSLTVRVDATGNARTSAGFDGELLPFIPRLNGIADVVNFTVNDVRAPLVFGGSIGTQNAPLSELNLNVNGSDITTSVLPAGFLPGISTIVFANFNDPSRPLSLPIAPGTFSINANTFRMGRNERLLSFGPMTIRAGTRASLGDIAVVRTPGGAPASLVVNSPDISINRREGTFILGSTAGGTLGARQDRGVGFVAEDAITFSSTPQVFGSGGATPTFATATGANISNTLGGFINLALPGGTNLFNLLTPAPRIEAAAFALDPTGTSTTSPISTIAALVVVDPPRVPESTGVSNALAEELRELRLNVRTDQDLLQAVEAIVGRALYNDFSMGDEALTSRGRLSLELARLLIEDFKAFRSASEQNAQALLVAREKFNETLPEDRREEPLNADTAADFRRFIFNTADLADARAVVVKLDRLFDRVDDLGLNVKEGFQVRSAIADQAATGNLLTSGEIVMMIDARKLSVATR